MSDVSPWPWASTECTLASCAWEAKDWTATELKPPGQFRILVTTSHPIPPHPKCNSKTLKKQAQPQKNFTNRYRIAPKWSWTFWCTTRKLLMQMGWLRVLTPTQIPIPENPMQAWRHKFSPNHRKIPPKWSWNSWCTVRKLLTNANGFKNPYLKLMGAAVHTPSFLDFSFFTRSILASPRFPPSSLNGADQTTHP